MEIKAYDNWACKLYRHDFYGFLLSEMIVEDGIHTIKLNDSVEIDLMVRGMKNTALYQNNFVCFFNGAISNRNYKTSPFFSGLGVFGDSLIPVISFSDPTIDLSSEISIGWYSGSRYFEKLQEIIAIIIKRYMSFTAGRPILIGGSGGGFAALSISYLLNEDTFSIVWNPQTNILKYEKEAVSKYARVAFNSSVDEFEGSLVERNINYNLVNNIQERKGKILFIQNRTDWHLQEHAIPFLLKNNVNLTNNNPRRWCGNIYYYFSNFGLGHVGPNKSLIKDIVFSIIEKGVPDSFCFGQLENENSLAVLDSDFFDFDVSVLGEKLEAVINFKNANYNSVNPKYCFYVYVDGERVLNTGYQSENILIVELKRLLARQGSKIEVIFFIMESGFRVNHKEVIQYRGEF